MWLWLHHELTQTHARSHTLRGLMEPISRRYYGLETSQAVHTPPSSSVPARGSACVCVCVCVTSHTSVLKHLQSSVSYSLCDWPTFTLICECVCDVSGLSHRNLSIYGRKPGSSHSPLSVLSCQKIWLLSVCHCTTSVMLLSTEQKLKILAK